MDKQKGDPPRKPSRRDPAEPNTKQGFHMKFDNYSTLTLSPAKLWKKFASKGYFDNAPTIKSDVEKRKESGKYCDCYKDWGHITDECYYLQDRLEKLVRDGTLKAYVKGSAPSTALVARREKTINAIFVKIDCMSKNQRARWSEDKKNFPMAVKKEHGYNY